MAQNEIALFGMKQGFLKENTLRLIRFGYPLLRVQANILSYKDNMDFCLIKKYIHRLVTGDRPTDENPIVYVQDRLHAFRLLGADKELYDVASYYYDELILNGAIHDTPQGALAGPAPFDDPSLKRIRSSRQSEGNLVVDMFTLDIYGNKVSSVRCRSLAELLGDYERDICLPYPPEYVGQPEVLEELINQRNFDFSKCTEEYMTNRLQEQNMPHGVQRIELVQEEEEDDPVEILWVPYYLALEKTEDGTQYCLYSHSSGRPIDLFPINSPDYKVLQQFLDQLLQGRYFPGITYHLTDSIEIPLTGKKFALEKDVTMDEDGNYHVPLTNDHLALICMLEEADTVDVLNLITKSVGVIPSCEAGRLVHFHLTEEQQAFCQAVLDAPQNRHLLAMPMLEQAAENDNVEAIYHLANCLLMGRGTEEDQHRAFTLYQKAAAKKHSWGQLYESFCHLNGFGTKVNPEASLASLLQINPRAPSYSLVLHNIGVAYLLQKEYANAAKALQQAESRNFVSPLTAYSLGYLYEKGLGVEQSYEEAVKRYQTAAKWGHIPARFSLAACYIKGTGVEANIPYAKQLLQEVIQPCPEDRLFYLGAKPFIPYTNFACTATELERRRKLLESLQQRAQNVLSKL